LPAAAEHLNDLEARCRPLTTGYDLVTWLNGCPDALVDGRVELERRMSIDAPRGAIELEEEDWDAARLRTFEHNQQEMGSDLVATGVVHRASAALAGFCEVSVSRARPEVAYQLDTIVAPAHRGHRLGLLLKIASTRLIMERSPATQRVKTENAVSNAPMIAVNDQLGYQLAGLGTAWQKDLA
jgi:RimJ/RimL family protein N-acetyltransferase